MSLEGKLDITHVLRGKITSLGANNAPDKTLRVDGASADSKATGDAIRAVENSLEDHKKSTANPHNVTKAQIGLGDVDNTADIEKPVSKAQAIAIADAKKAGTDALAGLGMKVDKEEDKALSSNDFTDEYKTKLDGIEEGANKYELPSGGIGTNYLAPKAVTLEKIADDAIRLRVTDVSVERNIFVDDTTDDEYKFRAAVYISGATAEMRPEITFGFAETKSGIFSAVCESFDGGVYIYANELPAVDFVIPVVEFWR